MLLEGQAGRLSHLGLSRSNNDDGHAWICYPVQGGFAAWGKLVASKT